MAKIIKRPIDIIAHFIPKSKFFLPLYFKNKNILEKRITIISFIIIIFLMFSVLETFKKILLNL